MSHKIGDLVFGSGIGIGVIDCIINDEYTKALLFGVDWNNETHNVYRGFRRLFSHFEITQMKYFLETELGNKNEQASNR